MASQPNVDIALQLLELQTDIALKYGVHLGTRTVQIVGEIDQNMYILVDTALNLLEQDSKATITVRINSEGGSVYDALAIVGRLRASKCQIITEGFGAVMSAATLILACGKKRRMSKFCTFMHHESSIELGGTLNQVEHTIIQMKRESDEWCKNMAQFSNKDVDFWATRGLLGQDLYLTATQCLEFGVIDEVI